MFKETKKQAFIHLIKEESCTRDVSILIVADWLHSKQYLYRPHDLIMNTPNLNSTKPKE